ncbi:hypothetical protein HK44_023635 [Pseudomonas fluorescens HK44]|uniref:Uncharacterized protein n=1 Tax=Pseudomonas fluorescens HK44 TaxID=1042209 RepID=A0A010SXV8_PSEFL|nr:hypothetical protein [Pseudomonas fluorescens]EXF95603.1 hypothetical protein HK44_023635 [Pseudomonas fluorescens HK44]
MTFPIQTITTPAHCSVEDLRDLQDILALLSLALAVIASPSIPIIVARVTAVMAQHTAMAWAELMEGMIDTAGGEQ